MRCDECMMIDKGVMSGGEEGLVASCSRSKKSGIFSPEEGSACSPGETKNRHNSFIKDIKTKLRYENLPEEVQNSVKVARKQPETWSE